MCQVTGQVTRQTNLGYSDSGLLQSARRTPEKNSDSMAGARSKLEGNLDWKWIRLGEQPHLTACKVGPHRQGDLCTEITTSLQTVFQLHAFLLSSPFLNLCYVCFKSFLFPKGKILNVLKILYYIKMVIHLPPSKIFY